jgi:hypothetical protein
VQVESAFHSNSSRKHPVAAIIPYDSLPII